MTQQNNGKTGKKWREAFWGESESVIRSVVSDSLRPHGLYPARVLCPWDFPGKNIGVGSHSLLWEIFPTQVPCTEGRVFTVWATLHCSKLLNKYSRAKSQLIPYPTQCCSLKHSATPDPKCVHIYIIIFPIFYNYIQFMSLGKDS